MRDIVEQAMRGDRDSFAWLVTKTSDRMFAIATRILRDTHLAEDALQAALVTAWRELRAGQDWMAEPDAAKQGGRAMARPTPSRNRMRSPSFERRPRMRPRELIRDRMNTRRRPSVGSPTPHRNPRWVVPGPRGFDSMGKTPEDRDPWRSMSL